MVPRPGRPAVGPRVSVRLDPGLLVRVDALASRTGSNRAATIRRLLDEAVVDPGVDTGVDIAQIRRALALTPAERVRAVVGVERTLSKLRGSAHS